MITANGSAGLAALILAAALLAPATPQCRPVTVGTVAEWQALQHQGWHGDPTDGREALYPPTCS